MYSKNCEIIKQFGRHIDKNFLIFISEWIQL